MITKEQLAALEAGANEYYMDSRKVSFEIENRQEELEGVLLAYEGMTNVSAQVLRQYFLNGGEVK